MHTKSTIKTFAIIAIFLVASVTGLMVLFPSIWSKPPFISSAHAQNEDPVDDRQEPSEDHSREPESNKLLVSVITISPSEQQASISGFGEINARWTTSLTTEVNGQVDFVSDKLLSGSHFDKGDVLLKINAVDYESEIATAKANVAAANVLYLEQKQETSQAKKRWELSGLSGKPSQLTLQTPQLNEALAALNSAKAELSKAQKNLARTEVVAPFNGRVSARSIDLGSYVSPGISVATIFSTGIMEVNIALNEKQFSLIGNEDQAVNTKVILSDTADESKHWLGRIARFQYHVDSSERTRNIVITLRAEDNANILLPGTFVSANIPGKTMTGLLKLPASTLSPDGFIWTVENGLLAHFRANIVFRSGDYIVLEAPSNTSELQVVSHPQTAFIPGQAVQTTTQSTKTKTSVPAASTLPRKTGNNA